MTISSTWKFEAQEILVSCGIDSERISRFEFPRNQLQAPSPLIFSSAEIHYCASLPDPAKGLCAAFCCKEALFKALGTPYNLCDCEMEPCFAQEEQNVRITEIIRTENKIHSVTALLKEFVPDELTVVVYTWRLP